MARLLSAQYVSMLLPAIKGAHMKTPPFDTGKVQIGLLYEPPIDYFPDEDASRIQYYLLKERNITWSNVSNAIRAHSKLAVIYLSALALVVVSIKW